MNEWLKILQKSLGTNRLTKENECPKDCYECCSLTAGTNIFNFRKLKKILKKEHLEKYYSNDESLWWTCPFLIKGKCSIYTNSSKPLICKLYTCSAELFLTNNNPKELFKAMNDNQKSMFDLLPEELQKKIIKNKRVNHILITRENVKNGWKN